MATDESSKSGQLGLFDEVPAPDAPTQKRPAWNRGKPNTPESNEKNRLAHLGKPAWNKGKPHTPEHKAALSEAWKTRPPATPETLEKQRLSRIGKKRTPEQRARMSAGMKGVKKGRPWSEKTRAAMRATWAAGRKGPGYSRGRRVKYKGCTFRSTYELRFAQALDRLGWEWSYEPKRFLLSEGSYLPDFFVPEMEAYIEIKGWFDERGKRRVRMFRDEYPDLPLVVINQHTLRQFELLQ